MIETGSADNATAVTPAANPEVLQDDDDIARPEATFRFTVQNISQLKEQVLSPPCFVRCLPWKILILLRHTTTPERQQQKALGCSCSAMETVILRAGRAMG